MNESLSPPEDADIGDSAHAETVVRRSGTSFFWAMRWLPETKRRAMYGIYAFCREVDDIADGDMAPAEKKAQLGQWRGEIERLYGDRPRTPVARALARPVADFGLSKADFRAIIDGMEMDAAETVRIADMAELDHYCDRVACAVGRLCVRVFGLDDDKGLALAFALGQALQLTNILRDIHEDAARDRLYIPSDLLRAHDIADSDLPAILNSANFPRACETLADVAARRFGEAREAIRQCDGEKVRPAVMMMEIYRRTLAKLRRRGWRDLRRPVGVSKPGKLWIAVRYGLFS